MRTLPLKTFLTIAFSISVLGACQPNEAISIPFISPAATLTPFFPDIDEETLPTASPTPQIQSYWIDPNLPLAVLDKIDIPADWQASEARSNAQHLVTVAENAADNSWLYVLVAAFPTLRDELTSDDLITLWLGDAAEALGDSTLLMTTETLDLFSIFWGKGDPAFITIVEPEDLLATAWENENALALIPFEELAPQWKTLRIDASSPIHEGFDQASYPLAIPLELSGDLASQRLTNWDPDLLTTVITTGVTALVRATAYEMNRSGITYPAEEIGELLASADITHISNEVPFWTDCPEPDPVQRNLIFCSDPDYFELLEVVGTDIVELTGDHFNDFGEEATLYTLDLYDERNLPYYGGGRNADDAKAAWTIEHNGNLIAFIGCNGKGGGYATADEDTAGAVECDYPYLAEEIARLRAAGYSVITTFQHDEVYTFIPQPGLVRDFGIVAEAGSSIVSGSQAHQAHGMQFSDSDTLIMYGLGNLFFDQKGVVENGDRALIGRHIFYENRYINTELITIFFVDFAKPRFMTTEERADFLTILFNASRFESSPSEGS